MRILLSITSIALPLLFMGSTLAESDSKGKIPLPAPTALPPPGTIVSEHTKNMGLGYREVSRSIVNRSNHWEGIGHFSFVYYKDMELCQCSNYEVLISPDGLHAVFVEPNSGKLILFRVRTGARIVLSRKYIGHPKSATWEKGRVVITVEKSRSNSTTTKTINAAL